MGNRYKREINMNGKNKRWLEQRWDMNQPARLAHIHKAKERRKMEQTHFHTYLYKKGKGSYEAKRFEGEAITAQAAATRYADQMARTCDYAEVRDAVGNRVYRAIDPHGKLAKGAEA